MAAGCSLSKIHKYMGSQRVLRASALTAARAEMLAAMRDSSLPEMPLRERAAALAESLTPTLRWRAWASSLEDRVEFEDAFALALDGVPTAHASAAMAWGILTSPRLNRLDGMAVRRQLADLIIGPAVLFFHRLGGSEAMRR